MPEVAGYRYRLNFFLTKNTNLRACGGDGDLVGVCVCVGGGGGGGGSYCDSGYVYVTL